MKVAVAKTSVGDDHDRRPLALSTNHKVVFVGSLADALCFLAEATMNLYTEVVFIQFFLLDMVFVYSMSLF